MEGNENTNRKKGFGDLSPVRVVLEGVEWSWGPNEAKTMEDRLATLAVAADNRLRIADTRDGFSGTART